MEKGPSAYTAVETNACARAIATFSGQDEVDPMVKYKGGLILKLAMQNFLKLKEEKHDHNLKFILMVIQMLSEFSQLARIHLLPILSSLVGVFLEKDVWSFPLRIEAMKLVNQILERLEFPEKLMNAESLRLFTANFDQWLKGAGDYELQITIMESLFCITSSQHRTEQVLEWFTTAHLQHLFLKIRKEHFDTDCREFLNYFNECNESNESNVYSYQVNIITLGKYILRKPQDVASFWVDLNVGSSSITAYTKDDDDNEGGWDIIRIKETAVRNVVIKQSGSTITFIIRLHTAASEMADFCPSADETYVIIEGKNHENMLACWKKIFGER